MRRNVIIASGCLIFITAWLAPSPYRYRFAVRPEPDLGPAIREMQERVDRRPGEALEKATLASMLSAQAKRSGDVSLYDRAERIARESLSELPFGNTGAKLTLARVAEARHRFREAIRLAAEIAREGKRHEALSVLVTSHLAIGKLDEADRESEELVRTKPALLSHAARALVLAAKGEAAKADESFRDALRAEDAGDIESSAWVRALFARESLKQGKLARARELLDEALRIVPDYHLAHDLLGELALQGNDPATAAREFGRAFAASRQTIYLHHHARALELIGNHEAAKALDDEAERSLRSDLRDGRYGHRLELARLLVDRGDARNAEEAERLARAELELRPTAETRSVLEQAIALRARRCALGSR